MKIGFSTLLAILSMLVFSCSEAQENGKMTTQQDDAIFEKVSVDEFDEISQKDGIQIIDVRTEGEVAQGKIPGSRNIDIMQSELFADKVAGLDREKPVLVYCKVGGRSAKAAAYLKENGFTEVYDLRGGFDSWSKENSN